MSKYNYTTTQPEVFMLGHIRKAVEENGKWYVEIDGRMVEVPQAILEFKRENEDNYYDDRIAYCKEKVEESCTGFQTALNAMRKFRKEFSSFLNQNDVRSINELSGKEHDEAMAILDNKKEAAKAKNSYMADVISYTNATISACCSKIRNTFIG